MDIHQVGDLKYYTFEQFPNGDLTHAIFGRQGGVSRAPFNSLNMSISVGDSIDNVRTNRRRALAALDLPPDDIADSWLVHGTHTQVVAENRDPDSAAPHADALVTNVPGVALFMRYADCVPIVLYDPEKHAIGLAHSGWRGSLNGSTRSAVQALIDTYHSRPADIIAGIGPSIGPQRYQVGPEVVNATLQAFPTHPDLVITRAGRTYLDLWATNVAALQQAGVYQIEVSGLCTATHTDKFFSHRGDKGRSGRFGAVITLRI